MIPGWKGYLIEGEKYSVEGMRFNLPSGTPVYAPENVEVTTVGFSANSTLIVLNSEKREFRIWIGGKNILVTQREYLEKGGTIGYVEDFAADPENPDVNMMLFVKTWK
jgi:murein DD-endopeptidase MepM/ murein hydrolase activator NlpD